MAVGMFYKWEDHNHGLEHKCGTCATVLSSPRAKKTCFGVHEEVCPAYHKTLHFVGASHKCVACSNAIKAHSKRHFEIAEILQAIHRLEGSSTTNNPLYNNKRKGKKRDDSDPDPSDDDVVFVDGADHEQEVAWDSSSSTLNNDDDAKERRQCWSGAMESADARKAAKAERKAAKNQVLFDVITQEELALVRKALHPESAISKSQGLADNRTIDENIAFNTNTFKWDKLRQSIHAKKLVKNNGGKQKPNTLQQDNEILSPILVSLGVSANLSKASKGRKSLDAKLRAAILGDLMAFENDQVETMQRMAGYWRYANKRTYNEMIRNNELWDWATGEKLPEIREELELDVIEEEDKNAEARTRHGETQGQVPENWDDPDFEVPDGQTVLSLSPFLDRLNTNHPPTTKSPADCDTKLDQEIESTRDRIYKLSSLSSKVPPPSPSDENRERLQDPSKTLNGSPTSRNPLSPITPNPHEKGFRGLKDTRVMGTAIRQPSPPSQDPPHTPQPTKTGSAPARSNINNKETPDLRNRFGALRHETPAPCDEVQKADPPLVKAVVKIPAKPIVKTLAIHDERDDWKTLPVLKGKKGVKGRPVVALREQAAVNVHARKLAGGKSFAAVVRRGL